MNRRVEEMSTSTASDFLLHNLLALDEGGAILDERTLMQNERRIRRLERAVYSHNSVDLTIPGSTSTYSAAKSSRRSGASVEGMSLDSPFNSGSPIAQSQLIKQMERSVYSDNSLAGDLTVIDNDSAAAKLNHANLYELWRRKKHIPADSSVSTKSSMHLDQSLDFSSYPLSRPNSGKNKQFRHPRSGLGGKSHNKPVQHHNDGINDSDKTEASDTSVTTTCKGLPPSSAVMVEIPQAKSSKKVEYARPSHEAPSTPKQRAPAAASIPSNVVVTPESQLQFPEMLKNMDADKMEGLIVPIEAHAVPEEITVDSTTTTRDRLDSSSNVKYSPSDREGQRVYIAKEDVVDHDVLCGQDIAGTDHPGNLKYYRMVKESKAAYQAAKKRKDKAIIRSSIINKVLEKGRFVVETRDRRYYLLTESKVQKKVSTSLGKKEKKEEAKKRAGRF